MAPDDPRRAAATAAGIPERKLRLIGSGLSFEPIHSVYAEGSQALLVDLHHLRGQLDKTADTVTYLAGTPLDTVYADLIAMDRMLPASPASSASRPWAVRSAPAPMGRDCTSPPCAMRWLP